MSFKDKSLEKYITAASFKAASIEAPNAWVGHLPFAAWITQQVKPKIFVELGTHTGNSYFSFCQTVEKHDLPTSCYAVDTWAGDEHAGHYSDEVFYRVEYHNREKYSHFSKLIRATFDDALSYFADASIELLHIDGLHTYEAVKHDFESWLPKLAPGAVVLFHDTQVRERNFGVWKLWQELKEQYPLNIEFLHSHGLGVLQLNNAEDHQKVDCLEWSSKAQQSLVRYFAALGDQHMLIFDLKEIGCVLAHRDGQLATLNQAVADRDGQLATLNQAVVERDGQLATLNQAVADRDGQLITLNQAVADRDGQLATLNQAVVERDGQLATLNQAVADRDGQLITLNQAVADRDEQIASLQQSLQERDGRIFQMEQSAYQISKDIHDLRLAVQSAKRWQKRSWAKRAFHRWRAPSDTWQKVHLLKKLERSFRKRRDTVMKSIFQKNCDAVRINSDTTELTNSANNKKSDFSTVEVEQIPTEALSSDQPSTSDIRAIAIYLPQFHAIPENDQWWGKGFTEWTNVRRATPQYAGHYQPHIPHPDIGYYDLNDSAVLEKQAALARSAGIEGFCFYYYWFNGRRLLNMPTDRLLATGKPDFPFCFCWANENWTRTWDGGDNQILLGQEHSHESDERFILDMLPAFRDPRYIRVDGNPLLVVYRPGLLPDPAATARHWREICRREGIGEIFLGYMLGFEAPLPKDIGFDCAIQMPPLRSAAPVINESIKAHDSARFVGEVRDYRYLSSMFDPAVICEDLWPGVCPSWDNTARRMERGHSWVYSSPEIYQQWLSKAVARARQVLPAQQRFVFINAWNEWAEGCHLEPDEKHGYAWLNATHFALTGEKPSKSPRILVVGHDAARNGAQIVLLQMLREWNVQALCEVRLVLLADGVLRSDFEEVVETLVLSDFPTEVDQKQALNDFCRPSPDVVLGNTAVIGPFLPNLKLLGVPIVAYIHELQKSIERWAPGPIMRATVEHSDHFIAVSVPVADNLHHTHGVLHENISTLNPYIKTSYRASSESLHILRAEMGIQSNEKIVFGCGTVDWRKGPDLFVEAAIEVLKHIPEARFIWIGGDGQDDSAARAHRLTKDSRIRFLGERANPRDYLALGHAFFLSSREDPFPLVALEAADSGLPVVCFADAGGMPEFVGSTCGRTVPFQDTQAASEALVELLSDDKLRLSLGVAAQQSVRAKHDAALGSKAVLSILKEKVTNWQAEVDTVNPYEVRTTEPLVSVIVPNYNHAKFLPERLASISNQSYRNLEIILLDDKSTDESLEILRDFVDREPRARLIENTENSGSTFKQWRKGLTEAKGKYVWIAESDDSAHPELVRTLIAKLENNQNAILATCCPRMVDLDGKDLGIPRDWFSDIGGSRWEKSFSDAGKNIIANTLSRKNAILNASGVIFRFSNDIVDFVDDSMRLCADWLFWVKLLEKGDFEYHGHPLNYWRLASSNARTKPAGEIEWNEGRKVINEIAVSLGLEPHQSNQLLKQYQQRCDEWMLKSK